MRSIDRIKCSTYNNDLERVERVREYLLLYSTHERLAVVFASLGHPVRVKIIQALCIEPLCVCELAALLAMSSPAVMHHIRTLGDAGVIEAERQGKFVVYSVLDPKARTLVLSGTESQLVGATL